MDNQDRLYERLYEQAKLEIEALDGSYLPRDVLVEKCHICHRGTAFLCDKMNKCYCCFNCTLIKCKGD